LNFDRDTTPIRQDGEVEGRVIVHWEQGQFACVRFDTAGLSRKQIGEALVAYKMVNGDGDDPDGLGGNRLMIDVVWREAVGRLCDVLRQIASPQLWR
jgi:hypothetical protein